MAVASVAAAVLLAGGGGAYWASTASSGPDGSRTGADGGKDGPPPLRLGSPVPGGTGGGPDGTGPGIAPGEPDPNGIVYRAEGELPEGPDSAAVHRAEGEVTAEEAARLAKALDVPGEPRLQDAAWRVGSVKDGTGAVLTVNRAAPGTWSFSRYPGGGDNCVEPGQPRLPAGAGQRCPAPGGGDTQDGADSAAVGEEAAKKAAAPVLKAVGQDEAKLDASGTDGAVRTVNADPVVGGLPTYGWATGVQVGSDGQIVGGSGRLKKPVKDAGYPVVGAEEALKALNSETAGKSTACATPVPLEGATPPGTAEKAPTGDPCAPSSGSPRTVTVKKAVFGLAAYFVDGEQALVPSWLFEVEPREGRDGTYTVTHPAVEPEYLEPAAPESPGAGTVDPGDGTAAETTTLPADSYAVEGRTLKVTFTGGVCHTFSVKAEKQEAGSVTVRVTSTPKDPGKVCITLAKEFTRSVPLDEPLGGRKVLDAATGEPVPKKK
ncbi:hypothetical protein GUY61_12165 [Streptomyces sp. GC420]|nr:hypothetical protein [Streptomyces sp. GC420]